MQPFGRNRARNVLSNCCVLVLVQYKMKIQRQLHFLAIRRLDNKPVVTIQDLVRRISRLMVIFRATARLTADITMTTGVMMQQSTGGSTNGEEFVTRHRRKSRFCTRYPAKAGRLMPVEPRLSSLHYGFVFSVVNDATINRRFYKRGSVCAIIESWGSARHTLLMVGGSCL